MVLSPSSHHLIELVFVSGIPERRIGPLKGSECSCTADRVVLAGVGDLAAAQPEVRISNASRNMVLLLWRHW